MSGTELKRTAATIGAYMLAGGITTSSPANELVAAAFAGVNYSVISLVTTIPNLMIVPCSLIAGAVAGKAISVKRLLIIAGILYLVGGISTFFLYQSIWTVLLTRALFGIGIGLATPLGLVCAYSLFEGERLQQITGCGTSAQSFICMLGVMLGGWLCRFGWRYTFLAHVIGVFGLIVIIIFLPEGNFGQAADRRKKRGAPPPQVFSYSLVIMLFMILTYPLYVTMSTVIIGNRLGDSVTVGGVLTLFTIGGIICGVVYGKAYRFIAPVVVQLILALATMGLFLVGMGKSLLIIAVGTFFVGAASIAIIPAVMSKVSQYTAPEMNSAASGMIMAAMNLGGFLVSGYYAVLESINLAEPLTMMRISSALMLILTLAMALPQRRRRKAV